MYFLIALLTKDHVMSNLLLVSKLLNDFSLKNTTSGRYNDIIDTFISEKHDFMVAQVQALLVCVALVVEFSFTKYKSLLCIIL